MSNKSANKLLEPFDLHGLKLPNRVIMASMTRGRAANIDLAPGKLQAAYYAQRASAGLIMAEGTWVNEMSVGFINVPGLYTNKQVDGWRLVTDAVHKNGGRIFAQLGHAGVMSHSDHLNGFLPVGPSAVNPKKVVFTTQGPADSITPRELSVQEIKETVNDYKKAAANAKLAGFDGVEIHVQHPSLISQFLSDALNHRTDEYGGSIPNKARFFFEVLESVIAVWGSGRISVKFNPYLKYQTEKEEWDDSLPTYEYLADKLNNYPLAFLQLLDHAEEGLDPKEHATRNVFSNFRKIYKGIIVANGGFTFEKANAILEKGDADLISFGVLYIANPDLVERIAEHAPLNASQAETFFLGAEGGYLDYPTLKEQQ